MRLSNCSGRKSPTAGPRGCKESTKPGPARHGPATARRCCRVGWHCAPRRRPSAAKHGQVPNRRCGKRLSVLHGHCCQRRRPHGQGGSGCHSSHFAGASDWGALIFVFLFPRKNSTPLHSIFIHPLPHHGAVHCCLSRACTLLHALQRGGSCVYDRARVMKAASLACPRWCGPWLVSPLCR